MVRASDTKRPGGATNTPGPVHLKEQADMHTLLSFFAVLARLLRPTRGVHTRPYRCLWELGAEA